MTEPYQPTPVELRMLAMVAEGYTRSHIGHEIGRKESAVGMTLSRLYARLGAINAPHAVAIGIRTGLIAGEVGR
jgi:DNA-binding CsgD family transcriptional regulator